MAPDDGDGQNSIQASDFNPAKLNNAAVIDDFNTSLQLMQLEGN